MIDHCKNENKGFLKLSRSKYKVLSPKIYYFHPENGVIVMRYYKDCFRLSAKNKHVIKIQENLEDLFQLDRSDADWLYDNIGRTPAGKFKILDLGIN